MVPMIQIGKLENRYLTLLITLAAILMNGYLDYLTGSEFSFSLFYLFPICFLALYKDTRLYSVFVAACVASLVWFIADYGTRQYSSFFFPVWNAFVRLNLFTAIGLLLVYLKDKDKKLHQVNDNLKTLVEEKNNIIGVAGHDLRNSISGIFTFSEILIDDYKNQLDARSMEMLRHIRTLSNNTLVLLQNLLDISAIESGKVRLTMETNDYMSFIREQLSLSQIQAGHKDMRISLHTDIESLQMEFDSHYLAEVIDNLLSNAIKYSYKGSEIIVRVSLPGNNRVLTEVIDHGKGIAREEQQGLFNYFKTTSTRPTAGEKSTGLGLAIVKKIVDLHHGEVWLSSEPDKGSVFSYTLPVNGKPVES